MVKRTAHESWFTVVFAEGVDPTQPGLYEWRIDGVGSYIGRYKRITRPTKEYARNVRNLIEGKPYRKGKPTLFRRIHHELAAAYDAKRPVQLIILENARPDEIRRRETELIDERGTLNGTRRRADFHIPWPVPGNPGGILRFETEQAWRAFIREMSVHSTLPKIIQAKFGRAQKLYLIGWRDADLIKVGELAALVELETGLRDRYFHLMKRRARDRGKEVPEKTTLEPLLRWMIEQDGLTNEHLPIYRRTGGNPVAILTGKVLPRAKGDRPGKVAPTLSEIRNSMAHGDPFDGTPTGGLLGPDQLCLSRLDCRAHRGGLENDLNRHRCACSGACRSTVAGLFAHGRQTPTAQDPARMNDEGLGLTRQQKVTAAERIHLQALSLFTRCNGEAGMVNFGTALTLMMAALFWLAEAVAQIPKPVASFDCAKATTRVEKLICEDPVLADADRDMGRAYNERLAGLAGAARESLIADQRRWLRDRDAKCATRKDAALCLLSETIERNGGWADNRTGRAGIDPSGDPILRLTAAYQEWHEVGQAPPTSCEPKATSANLGDNGPYSVTVAQQLVTDRCAATRIEIADVHGRVLLRKATEADWRTGVEYALGSVTPSHQQLLITEWSMGASDGSVVFKVVDLSKGKPEELLVLETRASGGFSWRIENRALLVTAGIYPDDNPRYTPALLETIRDREGEVGIRSRTQQATVRVVFDPASGKAKPSGTPMELALFRAMTPKPVQSPPTSRWYAYSYPTGECRPSDSPARLMETLKLQQKSWRTDDVTDASGEIVQTSVIYADSRQPMQSWTHTFFRRLDLCREFANRIRGNIDKYR